MAERTGISWTDATWNPIRGCSRVSEGCRHCYAEQVAARFSGPGQPYEGLAKKVGGEARWTGQVRFVREHLADPIRWQRPRRIFVNSMSDLFHEAVSDMAVAAIFAVMETAQHHTFQILTKRPERMQRLLNMGFYAGLVRKAGYDVLGPKHYTPRNPGWPLPNVWLGVSVEDQDAANARIPLLMKTPAALRFLSCEPLLGGINLTKLTGPFYEDGLVGREVYPLSGLFAIPDCDWEVPPIDWVIVGGESGSEHRPMTISWLTEIVEDCRLEEVPVFVKQDSGAKPGKQGRIPDDYWIQEFPQAVAV